jgi:hypothetical protein
MGIEIFWKYVVDGDEELDLCRVLYAYVHPESEDILYIGKADRCTVRERLKGKHKKDVFEYLYNEFGMTEMGLLVGELMLPEGSRYSSALLADIESLLIYNLEPLANIQNIGSRISRLGLVVSCSGEWPSDYDEFVDEG